MMDWDLYRFILALYRTGTMRGAAADLGVNHATVSRRLAHLNETHAAPIFERVAGKYKVTRLGEPLVSAAEHMESIALQAERQKRSIDNTISGSITLSMSEVIGQYLLRDELIEFSNLYPKVELNIVASYRLVDLDRSEADVVVRGHNDPPEHLVGRRLFNYGLSYYAHKDYLAITPEGKRRWLSFNLSNRPINWVQSSPFPDVPILMRVGDLTLNVNFYFSDIQTGRLTPNHEFLNVYREIGCRANRGEQINLPVIRKTQYFRDLIDLHIADMKEVRKPLHLKRPLQRAWAPCLQKFSREQIVEFD